MSKHRYNIALIGKTGTGKSALVNFLFETRLAGTGTGLPVTPRGFHPYEFLIHGLPVRVFDSWGLEADKSRQWLQELEAELDSRGPDRPAHHWFHTVLYCINAGGHRIEPFEVDIIKTFLSNSFKVAVILTKADLAAPDYLAEMTRTIQNLVCQDIPVIPVCAEKKVLKSGVQVRPFGRQEVFAQVVKDLRDSICLRLPRRCVAVTHQIILEWQQCQMHVLKSTPFHKLKHAQTQVALAAAEFQEHIRAGLLERAVIEELHSTLSMYNQFGAVVEDIPQSLEIPPLQAPSQHKFPLHFSLPLLAGPLLAPIAFAATWVIGNRIAHRKFIRSLNNYCSQLALEAEKLGPEIEGLLRAYCTDSERE